MNSNGKKPKYIHPIYDEKVCVEQVNKQTMHKPCDMICYFVVLCLKMLMCSIVIILDRVYPVQSSVSSLNSVKSAEISDDVIICDVTENDTEVMAEISEGSPRAYEQG